MVVFLLISVSLSWFTLFFGFKFIAFFTMSRFLVKGFLIWLTCNSVLYQSEFAFAFPMSHTVDEY